MDLFACCGLGGGNIRRLNALLEATNLNHVHQLPNVVILKDTATVDDALKNLPLDRPDQLLGFVDVKDILASLLVELGPEDLGSMKMLQRVRKLEAAGSGFASKMLKDLPVFGLDGELFPDSQGTASIRDLMVYFLLSPDDRRQVANLTALPHRQTHAASATVHRVAVYSSSFQVKNILSQSDLVKFLYNHRGSLGPLSKMTLQELGWASRPVITVRPDMVAIAAMQLMQEKGIGAVAVVDRDGKILGNFSMSEMRTIMAEHFGALAMPVGEFLAMEHGTDFWSISRKQSMDVDKQSRHSTEGGSSVNGESIHVSANSASTAFVKDKLRRSRGLGCEVGQALVLAKPQDTFLGTLERLVKNRLHRMYVIDAGSKPVGVVTCSDIIRKVVECIAEL